MHKKHHNSEMMERRDARATQPRIFIIYDVTEAANKRVRAPLADRESDISPAHPECGSISRRE